MQTMMAINNFIFRLNVSIDTYTNKKEATACLSQKGARSIEKEKMAFVENSLTVQEFLFLATSGHTFCNLFDIDPNKKYWVKNSDGKKYQVYPVYRKGKNKGGMKLTFKCDEFFNGAQAIFVDVDNTRFSTIPEYINRLSFKPTCVYMSFSDKIEKHGIISRRFRLVYVFDRILNRHEFESVSQSITKRIIIDTAESMADDCGTRLSQYMNGVWGNNETYQTNCIYSPSDFPPKEYVIDVDLQEEGEGKITFDDKLLWDMESMSYEDFMHLYSWKYKYVYRSEKPEWIDGAYQLTEEGYLQLWYYRERQCDGEHRRRKLFKNACLRYLMYPDIDSNTLLFNLYVDLCRFFDNSDGVITMDVLKRKVKNALLMNGEQLEAYCHFEIEYWQKNRPRFITNPNAYCSLSHINQISKIVRWAEIDNLYDRTKSVKENHEHLQHISMATLYRYCKENAINTSPKSNAANQNQNQRLSRNEKKELFKMLYNPDFSIRKNKNNMELRGLSLSIGTIQQWSNTLTPTHLELQQNTGFKAVGDYDDENTKNHHEDHTYCDGINWWPNFNWNF